MEKLDNRTRLKIVMAKHDLSAQDVADMLDVGSGTVNQWKSVSACNITNNMLDLLQFRLANKASMGTISEDFVK